MTAKANGSVTSVDALIEATIQAREVIRQAHEATKDLRQVIKEVRQMQATITTDAAQAIINGCAAMVQTVTEAQCEAMDQLKDAYEGMLARMGDGMPITMLCPSCGQLLAMLIKSGARQRCPRCQAEFALFEPDPDPL